MCGQGGVNKGMWTGDVCGQGLYLRTGRCGQGGGVDEGVDGGVDRRGLHPLMIATEAVRTHPT